jgi:hypothetical protein
VEMWRQRPLFNARPGPRLVAVVAVVVSS